MFEKTHREREKEISLKVEVKRTPVINVCLFCFVLFLFFHPPQYKKRESQVSIFSRNLHSFCFVPKFQTKQNKTKKSPLK